MAPNLGHILLSTVNNFNIEYPNQSCCLINNYQMLHSDMVWFVAMRRLSLNVLVQFSDCHLTRMRWLRKLWSWSCCTKTLASTRKRFSLSWHQPGKASRLASESVSEVSQLNRHPTLEKIPVCTILTITNNVSFLTEMLPVSCLGLVFQGHLRSRSYKCLIVKTRFLTDVAALAIPFSFFKLQGKVS